ncbi:methyltransferase family protein [Pseudoxanthomonas indica]|nr:isoprenylcysteine carboxylmethyltransferase family protein [Pseudoxanthomonas indica]
MATLAWVAILHWRLPALPAIVLLVVSTAIPMWLLELRRHSRAFDHGDHERQVPLKQLRLQRLIGLAGVAILFASSITMQNFLAKDWIVGVYEWTLPAAPVLGFFCLWQLFCRPGPPSPIEELGISIVGAWNQKRLDAGGVQILLGWVVKAFFLPLMLAWSYVWLADASDQNWNSIGWASFFAIAMAWLYAIDTAFATIGYMSTSRRIGAHIRSVDTALLGWLSALACYPPLSLLVLRTWLEYKDGFEWDAWLHASPALALVWGAAILLLTAIYTLSTVMFGPRFSNLTNRGIITSGPYRYCKHPAYFCKNLSWWLISVPFVANAGLKTALFNSLALIGVNIIYWLRARTEERHLMQDESYRQYAAWIDKHGLLGSLRHRLAGRS